MDDWAKIRQLFSTGEHSKREIGRLVGVSRGTVERALETDRLPKYQRPAVGSSFDLYAPQVLRRWVDELVHAAASGSPVAAQPPVGARSGL